MRACVRTRLSVDVGAVEVDDLGVAFVGDHHQLHVLRHVPVDVLERGHNLAPRGACHRAAPIDDGHKQAGRLLELGAVDRKRELGNAGGERHCRGRPHVRRQWWVREAEALHHRRDVARCGQGGYVDVLETGVAQ